MIRPETVFEPFLNPTKQPVRAPKSQNDPEIKSKLNEMKETKKMKVAQVHKQTPKQLFNPTPIPEIAHQGPKIKSNPKVRIEGSIENKSCSAI